MAKMIDQKPTLHGEAKLWSCLESYLPNDTIVYHNREVNGREFDFCLLMENYGVLVIEVKKDITYVSGVPESILTELGLPTLKFSEVKEPDPNQEENNSGDEQDNPEVTTGVSTVPVAVQERVSKANAILTEWSNGKEIDYSATGGVTGLIRKAVLEDMCSFLFSTINWQVEGISDDNINKVKSSKKLLCLERQEEYVSPEYRAQRKINESRIPIITKYILDNRDSYVFSALASSIDGAFRYIPLSEDSSIGVLEISMDAKFLINDGQHRKAAIIEALKEDASLGDETISIVFYADKGLERSQQIFTDLNKNAVKTSNSISELYDSRDQVAVITRNVIKRVDFLNTYTDKEKDILGRATPHKDNNQKTFRVRKNAAVEGDCRIFDFYRSSFVQIWVDHSISTPHPAPA